MSAVPVNSAKQTPMPVPTPVQLPVLAAAEERVLILDFGSQYAQLIARRVREQNVYCEIVRHDITAGPRAGTGAQGHHPFRRAGERL